MTAHPPLPPHRPGPRGDGDGWVDCALGHRHWGVFGAAGLLVHRPARRAAAAEQPCPQPGEQPGEVLLQHRATWSHHGGTWGLLGGARNSGESAVAAALREAAEEGGLAADHVEVHGRFDDAHGGWAYATVIASARAGATARATGGESIDVAWVAVEEVSALPLHPGFAAAWPLLRDALDPVTVVLDAANVVGSTPDGWWRDRVGAADRLIRDVQRVAAEGLSAEHLPAAMGLPPLRRWWPQWVVVVEGQARRAAAAHQPASGLVRAVAAPGAGDDSIVGEVAGVRGPVLVVTADRELRERCAALSAATVGPRWFATLRDGRR